MTEEDVDGDPVDEDGLDAKEEMAHALVEQVSGGGAATLLEQGGHALRRALVSRVGHQDH